MERRKSIKTFFSRSSKSLDAEELDPGYKSPNPKHSSNLLNTNSGRRKSLYSSSYDLSMDKTPVNRSLSNIK